MSSSKVELSMDHLENAAPRISITNTSSSFEKVVSACTGAVITMSFSKQLSSLLKNIKTDLLIDSCIY